MADEDERYKGFKVGHVDECEEVSGKDKLKKLTVDIGGGKAH